MEHRRLLDRRPAQLRHEPRRTVTSWDTGSNARTSSSPYLKNGDDIADVYTLQAMIVPALKFSDTLRFEAGFGYRMDNADGAPGFSQTDEEWVAYLQAMITMAPGVYLCPEVGYYDYMDGVNGHRPGQPVVRRRQVADRLLI